MFRNIVSIPVDALSPLEARDRVLGWSGEARSRAVFFANVHMAMEAHDSGEFARILGAADLVAPDGMPLVAALRLLGFGRATRVYGPDTTLLICEEAARRKIPVAFYGGTEKSLSLMQGELKARFPGLEIACAISPPFRPPTPEEDARDVAAIRDSGARLLFVGIGCPKQEIWIHRHRESLPLVMLGVGAAFDFISGQVRQAPAWVQGIGLEWLFRLLMDPRRLWKRYLKHNPRFVALLARQLVEQRLLRRDPRP